MRQKIRNIADKILQVVTVLSAIMLTTSVIFYALNCFMRYVVRAPLAWPEEYCVYIVVLMVYFMQCKLEFHGEELCIGVLDNLIAKSKAIRIVQTLIQGAVTIFIYCHLFFNVGLGVVAQQNQYGILSPVMRFEMGVYFGLINACFLLVVIFWVINILTKDYDKVEEQAIE